MNTFIGYATNSQIRYSATSGGVGSALVKYLFEQKIIDTAISFDFDPKSLQYIPKIIHDFNEYKMHGSIYQEIDIVNFLKCSDLSVIERKVALFCLPCQSRPIRNLFAKLNKEVIIIGLTCSSQQSLEATHYLLHRLYINEDEVEYLQYRGNGWPSGIQIRKKNGESVFVPNNNSLWTQIFHSRLFIQQRCFGCQNTLNENSDIVLADPWLKDYLITEKEGQTLFAAYTEVGQYIVEKAFRKGYIVANSVGDDLLTKSQTGTILRKQSYKSHPTVRRLMKKIFISSWYKKIFKYPLLFKLHCKMKAKIEYYLLLKTNNCH